MVNGWFVHGDRVVWGYAQHNGWWRAGQRPNLTRRAPGQVRPNRTEDLDKLTDNMLRYGYPGFEHNFGLWYDRRRDAHDTTRRIDGKVVSPFLEQPWARAGRKGVRSHLCEAPEGPSRQMTPDPFSATAWDGLAKYDLTKYNAWYFERLRTFAGHCDRKGAVLLHNFYMQHALLETNAHYVDFPWRPDNCTQKTGMPASTPAANTFYDVTHPERRRLHRAYIRKCLDELGRYNHVVHLAGQEYTGPKPFMEFWLDTVAEWEKENDRDVLVALGATKDVLDALADDPRVDVLDLRYWWYRPDGSLFAPPGGKEVPGRYNAGSDSARTTPEQIYRQTKQYRLRYPNKGIIHTIEASRQQTWAFLMGGGSMLVRRLEAADGKDPPGYGPPPDTRIIQPTYDFIRGRLSKSLQKMVPKDLVSDNTERIWCLAEPNHAYLVYALAGGRIRLDLAGAAGMFQAKWFDPRTGKLQLAAGGMVEGGRLVEFDTPDANDWALWLTRVDPQAATRVEAGPERHLIRHADRLLVLVGDSGTQCVMQNPNIDYRRWIDDCAEAGLNSIHIWSFVAPRQNRDREVIEARYGYLYPGITPWSRRADGPAAHDGRPQWDLLRFDEGDDPQKHYWPRLRDLCGYARQKGLLVGITVFFGWPKHNSPQRPDWSYHPWNVLGGGHLTDDHPIVRAVQQIASPGHEILGPSWSDSWDSAKKTQWLWERFAAKLLEATQPFGNTFYIFMDERSYAEGNCGDHFAAFFRRRKAFWIDGQLRREKVDGVIDGHGPQRNINQAAYRSFRATPPRPFFEFELPPYRGSAVRDHIYGCLLGGGHYFFHNDEGQETPTTGIMSYDPHVRDSRIEAVRQRLRWLGIASQFMNEQVRRLRGMQPHNEAIHDGAGYCLARPGVEYVVYVKSGNEAEIDLQGPAASFEVNVMSPRTGKTHRVATKVSGSRLHVQLPDGGDWLIHLTSETVLR